MNGAITPEGMMSKAVRACTSARALLDLNDEDGACNRAYYAMFGAARAALLATDAPVETHSGKTHSGLIAAFGLHLVKNGPVPREMGRLLKRAEEIWLVSDYHGASIDPEDARQLVVQAEEFIAAMRVLIEKPTV